MFKFCKRALARAQFLFIYIIIIKTKKFRCCRNLFQYGGVRGFFGGAGSIQHTELRRLAVVSVPGDITTPGFENFELHFFCSVRKLYTQLKISNLPDMSII